MKDPPIRLPPARIDTSIFSFQSYNPVVPLLDQPCLGGFEGDIPRIESKRMMQVRETVHGQGGSISTAFTVLDVASVSPVFVPRRVL